MSAWRRLTFSLPRSAHEDLIVRLHDSGCLGVETRADDVVAWFPATLDEAVLLRGLRNGQGATPRATMTASDLVEDGRWHERWMESLEPFDIGQGFLLAPGAVLPVDTRGRRVIRLTPGRAFGTGEHATTRMCLAMLEQEVRPDESLLDTGTGSGILAIAARLLGARDVVGLDIDETSVQVAARNLILNETDGVHLLAGTMDALRPRLFDVVVANISAAALVRLMAPLAARTGRAAILSGILQEEEHEVSAAAARAGLEVDHRMSDDGWIAIALKRGTDV